MKVCGVEIVIQAWCHQMKKLFIKRCTLSSHIEQTTQLDSDYLEGFANVASIHVISKCGHEVEGAPMGATTVVLPNIGRCDHTYAYFITTIFPSYLKDDNSIVVFMKDTSTDEFEHNIFSRTKPKSLVHIASSSNGFACGVTFDSGSWSPYHDKDTLFTFEIKSYGKGEKDYKMRDCVPFQSTYNTLREFYDSLNVTPSPGSVVQACYGGIFAAPTANIFKQDMRVWKTIEKALERGDNIQEGHYMERSRGILLATPLKAFQIEALKNHSTKVRIKPCCIHGSLLREGKDASADDEDEEYDDDEDDEDDEQQQQIKEEEKLPGGNWEVFHFYVLAGVGVISAVSVIAFTLSIGTTGRQRGLPLARRH